ncbi:peptidoglycan-binding protein LysM [Primorskyibacter sp. S187A]|uniref:peptidoglycan-binding protein LysM n=1 Tax=Primorskyibacter sp. S187A TaxID=3415130 RepID=UPI003C7CDA6B
MGLWSFVKNSGKKLFGGDDAPEKEALEKELADLGLDASGVDIIVEGDTVKLEGAAGDDELKEKIILAVGNVEGVAAVEDQTSGGGTEPVFHTVAKGDTLWAIAEKTLGKGTRYQDIFEANRPMLSHPDKIYPGQVLRIPQD